MQRIPGWHRYRTRNNFFSVFSSSNKYRGEPRPSRRSLRFTSVAAGQDRQQEHMAGRSRAVIVLLLLHILLVGATDTIPVPTTMPSLSPTYRPTAAPTMKTNNPTITPTLKPTTNPTTKKLPTMFPTTFPTLAPISGIYSTYMLRTFVFLPNTTVEDINATDARNTLTRTMKYLLDSYQNVKVPPMSVSVDIEEVVDTRRNLFNYFRSLSATGTNAYYSMYFTLDNTGCADETKLVDTVNAVIALSGSSDCNTTYYCFIDTLHYYDSQTKAMKFKHVNYVNVSDTYIEVQSVIISKLQSENISFVDSHKEVLLMFVVALVYIFVFIASGVKIALHKKSKLSIKSNEGMLTAIENTTGKTLMGLMNGKSSNKVAAPLFVSRRDIEKPQINNDDTDTGLQMQKGNLFQQPRPVGSAAPVATQMPKTVTLDRSGPLGGAAPLATQMPKTVTLPRPGMNAPPRSPLSINSSPRGLPPPPPPPTMQNARPPPPRPPAANTPPPPSPPSADGAGASEKFSSFKKLLNMNVPEMAVRNKMLMQGISQSEIDIFFNTR